MMCLVCFRETVDVIETNVVTKQINSSIWRILHNQSGGIVNSNCSVKNNDQDHMFEKQKHIASQDWGRWGSGTPEFWHFETVACLVSVKIRGW